MRLYGLIGKALLDAKQNGSDPFAAIETVISWDAFAASITEAENWRNPKTLIFTTNWRELCNFTPLRARTSCHT